ncbi:3'(2'), 5'-bisphosphate nucleotidase [Arthrobacter sp. CAN_A6]|uniref:3'(2'),5'-bisphosphate nucleotidase CysQ n=1 Tax=Arthrobacter sp. CAN_A6 TaxID=2787721 RepID=UPI0018C923C9
MKIGQQRLGDFTDDLTVAVRTASEAGRMLLKLQSLWLSRGLPADVVKQEGDGQSQDLISRTLSQRRPLDCVLSEEATDSTARLGADRVWIVDPLDGTREFSEGRTDWAVHVALWERSELVAAAVALPGLGMVLHSGEDPTIRTGPIRTIRIAVSRSRAPHLVTEVAEHLQADLRPMGSAGYKVAAVIRGEADAYIHAGGQYEWDSAAPVAVALSRGLHASRIDGSELVYNQKDPYLPDLLVCRPELAEQLLTTIDTVQQGRMCHQ